MRTSQALSTLKVYLDYPDQDSSSTTTKMISSFFIPRLGHISTDECLELIKSIKRLYPNRNNEAVQKIYDYSVGIFARTNSSEVEKLKDIDSELYLRTLAEWISLYKIPIIEAKINQSILNKIAPYLRYLDISDRVDPKTKRSCYTEKFIMHLLKNCKQLEFLKLSNCQIADNTFSRFTETAKLETLIIENCATLSERLPQRLPNLKELRIDHCTRFNGELPKRLDKLETLEIKHCPQFNRPLPSFSAQFNKLVLTNNKAFDQKIPASAAHAKEIAIRACPTLNQIIPGEIFNVHNLSIDHSLELLTLISAVCAIKKKHEGQGSFFQTLKKVWAVAYEDERKNVIEELLAEHNRDWLQKAVLRKKGYRCLIYLSKGEVLKHAFTDSKVHLRCLSIEKMLENPQAFSQLASILDGDQWELYLTTIGHYFPKIAVFLNERMQNRVAAKLQNFDEIDSKLALAFLPCLRPEQIRSTIENVPESKKSQWLMRPIFIPSIFRSANLEQLRNLQLSDHKIIIEHYKDHNELIIPITTLVGFAATTDNKEAILLYAKTFPTVVLPVLSAEVFIEIMNRLPAAKQKYYLKSATEEQKKAYDVNDAFYNKLDELNALIPLMLERNQIDEVTKLIGKTQNRLQTSLASIEKIESSSYLGQKKSKIKNALNIFQAITKIYDEFDKIIKTWEELEKTKEVFDTINYFVTVIRKLQKKIHDCKKLEFTSIERPHKLQNCLENKMSELKLIINKCRTLKTLRENDPSINFYGEFGNIKPVLTRLRKKNTWDYTVSIIIQQHPIFLQYLISNMYEGLPRQIQRLKVNIFELDEQTQIILLPLLSSDDSEKILRNIRKGKNIIHTSLLDDKVHKGTAIAIELQYEKIVQKWNQYKNSNFSESQESLLFSIEALRKLIQQYKLQHSCERGKINVNPDLLLISEKLNHIKEQLNIN